MHPLSPFVQYHFKGDGDGVKLVSSALEVAKVVKEMIEKSNLNRDEKLNPVYRYIYQ